MSWPERFSLYAPPGFESLHRALPPGWHREAERLQERAEVAARQKYGPGSAHWVVEWAGSTCLWTLDLWGDPGRAGERWAAIEAAEAAPGWPERFELECPDGEPYDRWERSARAIQRRAALALAAKYGAAPLAWEIGPRGRACSWAVDPPGPPRPADEDRILEGTVG